MIGIASIHSVERLINTTTKGKRDKNFLLVDLGKDFNSLSGLPQRQFALIRERAEKIRMRVMIHANDFTLADLHYMF